MEDDSFIYHLTVTRDYGDDINERNTLFLSNKAALYVTDGADEKHYSVRPTSPKTLDK